MTNYHCAKFGCCSIDSFRENVNVKVYHAGRTDGRTTDAGGLLHRLIFVSQMSQKGRRHTDNLLPPIPSYSEACLEQQPIC